MNRRITIRRLLITTALVAIVIVLFFSKFSHSLGLVNQPNSRFQIGDRVHVVHKTKQIGFGNPMVLAKSVSIVGVGEEQDFQSVTIRVIGANKLRLWLAGDAKLLVWADKSY